MEFTFVGADPRFLHLKRRLETDGHSLTPNSGNIVAPPAERRGIPYWADLAYTVENAALTAEGAVWLAMRRSDRALAGQSALVVGYGRIGRLLADKLAALGVCVTVAARSAAARAEAAARGHNSVDINFLTGSYSMVLNTVPAPVLTGSYGASLCLDLASDPGGWTDDTPVLKAPGLPGIYAPRSGADVMANAIYRVMEVDIK